MLTCRSPGRHGDSGALDYSVVNETPRHDWRLSKLAVVL